MAEACRKENRHQSRPYRTWQRADGGSESGSPELSRERYAREVADDDPHSKRRSLCVVDLKRRCSSLVALKRGTPHAVVDSTSGLAARTVATNQTLGQVAVPEEIAMARPIIS